MKAEAKQKGWVIAPECCFYGTSLGYLKNVASSFQKELGASAATIEMLLFAKAEELVREAFPNEKFN